MRGRGMTAVCVSVRFHINTKPDEIQEQPQQKCRDCWAYCVLAGAVRAAPGQRYHSSRYPRTIFFISLKMISRRAVVVKHCSEALQPVLLDSVR